MQSHVMKAVLKKAILSRRTVLNQMPEKQRRIWIYLLMHKMERSKEPLG